MFLFSLKPFLYNNGNLISDQNSTIISPTYSGKKLIINKTSDNSAIDYTNSNNTQDITDALDKTSVFYSPTSAGFIHALSTSPNAGGRIDVALVTNVAPADASKFKIIKKSDTIFTVTTVLNGTNYALCCDKNDDVFLSNDILMGEAIIWNISFYIERQK